MTVYRRRQEYGMVKPSCGNVSDNELHIVLNQMQIEFPALGQTMVWGRLRSMGIVVTRARVCEAIRTTDPIHAALR